VLQWNIAILAMGRETRVAKAHTISLLSFSLYTLFIVHHDGIPDFSSLDGEPDKPDASSPVDITARLSISGLPLSLDAAVSTGARWTQRTGVLVLFSLSPPSRDGKPRLVRPSFTTLLTMILLFSPPTTRLLVYLLLRPTSLRAWTGVNTIQTPNNPQKN